VFFFRTELCNKMEGTLTGLIREDGAEEDMWGELGQLTGSWRNLQNEEIRDYYRCLKIIGFMKMPRRVLCAGRV